MGSIEEWAGKWLENQRHKGKTCLEIKMRGSTCYVYHSTNRYDKEIKKGRKVSKYHEKLDSISQAEKGYNKDKIQLPRINLALLCSADTGLPTMIRSLPGSVKDIKTLYHSINELDTTIFTSTSLRIRISDWKNRRRCTGNWMNARSRRNNLMKG
jgi:transposase